MVRGPRYSGVFISGGAPMKSVVCVFALNISFFFVFLLVLGREEEWTRADTMGSSICFYMLIGFAFVLGRITGGEE
jgi:hypothetical protein